MAEDDKNEDKNDEKKDEKTFTQEEVNALMKKNADKEREAMLKDLGVKSPDDIKSALAKLKEFEEKKPEEKGDEKPNEKKDPAIETLKKELEALKADNQKFQAENRAKDIKQLVIKMGAEEKYASQVVKLLPDEDVTEETVKKFLNDNPIYVKKGEAPDFGGKSGEKGKKSEEDVKARLSKAMGLKKSA